MTQETVGLLVEFKAKNIGVDQQFKSVDRQAKSLISTVDTINTKFDNLGRIMRASFLGISFLAVARSVSNLTGEVGALYDQSQKLGITVSQFKALSIVAEEVGSSGDEIAQGLYKLKIALGNVAGGSGEAGQALNTLMLSYRELNGLPIEEKMFTILDRLKMIKDENIRTATAVQLFGRGAGSVLALLNTNYRQLTDEISKTHAALDQTAPVLDQLGETSERVAQKLKTGFATALGFVASGFESWADGVISDIDRVGQSLLKLEQERAKSLADPNSGVNKYTNMYNINPAGSRFDRAQPRPEPKYQSRLNSVPLSFGFSSGASQGAVNSIQQNKTLVDEFNKTAAKTQSDKDLMFQFDLMAKTASLATDAIQKMAEAADNSNNMFRQHENQQTQTQVQNQFDRVVNLGLSKKASDKFVDSRSFDINANALYDLKRRKEKGETGLEPYIANKESEIESQIRGFKGRGYNTYAQEKVYSDLKSYDKMEIPKVEVQVQIDVKPSKDFEIRWSTSQKDVAQKTLLESVATAARMGAK